MPLSIAPSLRVTWVSDIPAIWVGGGPIHVVVTFDSGTTKFDDTSNTWDKA